LRHVALLPSCSSVLLQHSDLYTLSLPDALPILDRGKIKLLQIPGANQSCLWPPFRASFAQINEDLRVTTIGQPIRHILAFRQIRQRANSYAFRHAVQAASSLLGELAARLIVVGQNVDSLAFKVRGEVLGPAVGTLAASRRDQASCSQIVSVLFALHQADLVMRSGEHPGKK